MFKDGPLSVLLIEDDSTQWRKIPALLAESRPTRLQVIAVTGVAAGLDALANHMAHVILLAMPAGDRGLPDLTVLLGRCDGCPVIVLGHDDDPELASAMLARGAADYLPQGQCDGPLLARAVRYAAQRVTDLEQMKAALAKERSLLRAVIDSVPDHIYVKDTHHRFVLTNLATQQFFGRSGEALAGKTDQDLFPPDAASSFRWEEEQVLQSGQPRINREEHVVAANGLHKWTLTTKVPLRDHKANVIGIVGINRDITVRKSAIQQLEQTNVKLARREQELLTALEDLRRSHEALQNTQLQLLQVEKMESVGRLAAGIAHEVKNPLAIIATGIDFLKQTLPPERDLATRALASMGRAVERADSVIRGLLDFSAPAALYAAPCDLNSVIRQALLLVDHELMRMQSESTRGIGRFLAFGFDRRQQGRAGLSQLVHQRASMRCPMAAESPSARGPSNWQTSATTWATTAPTVSAPAKSSSSPKWMTPAMAFPKINCPRSSTPFSPPSRPAKGPGLDFRLPKPSLIYTADCCNCSIVPRGACGRCSCSRPLESFPMTQTNLPKTRVLIVDDEEDFTLMMGMALRQTGNYDTREENNALNTVSAAREFQPHVVLLDVMMPEADGGDIAGDLKADDATAHVPIIFLTALVGNEETTLGGLVSGGHRFLPKPVSLAELTQCIAEVTGIDPSGTMPPPGLEAEG